MRVALQYSVACFLWSLRYFIIVLLHVSSTTYHYFFGDEPVGNKKAFSELNIVTESAGKLAAQTFLVVLQILKSGG